MFLKVLLYVLVYLSIYRVWQYSLFQVCIIDFGFVSGEQLEYQNYKKQKEKEDKRKPVKQHT